MGRWVGPRRRAERQSTSDEGRRRLKSAPEASGPTLRTIPLVDRVRLATAARRHWLFGLVLAGAVALRVLVMLAFRPIMWFGGDDCG